MQLKGKKIGFAVTGSHCTIDEIIPQVDRLIAEGADIHPIFSPAVANTKTRFGSPEKWRKLFEARSSVPIITEIVDAEPIGPKSYLDAIVVAPCTGNTLAKLANGITDTCVLMAIKAQLRNEKPVILGISTNDGLGLNAKNIGVILNTPNIFMVPFSQDSPTGKPNSTVAHMNLILETVLKAIEGKQIQPVITLK